MGHWIKNLLGNIPVYHKKDLYFYASLIQCDLKNKK